MQFIKGGQYPMNFIPKPNTGKCKYCSCPVVFHPIIEPTDEKTFKFVKYRTTDSKGQSHHCFKYKIDSS